MQRLDTTTTDIDDFRKSGWRTVITSPGGKDYDGLWRSLHLAAGAAAESGEDSKENVLRLLAHACWFRLDPDNKNEPFKPIFAGERASLFEYFQEHDLDLLAQISEEVEEPWLQARLADLIWHMRRSPKHARLAIDAYRAIPLDAKTWMWGVRKCWQRAIRLSHSLKGDSGERLQEIEASLLTSFNAASEDHGFWAYWLSEFLLFNRLGEGATVAIAEKLRSLAQIFNRRKKLHQARTFFEASGRWFDLAGDASSAAEMAVFTAEAWVEEASSHQSQLVAAGFCKNAIQVYLKVPRAQREGRKSNERLAEIYRLSNEAGKRGLEEFDTFTPPPFNIEDIVLESQSAVEGTSAIGALSALVNIYQGFQATRLSREAEDNLSKYPSLTLFPATYFSGDGREIASLPAGWRSDDCESVIWAEMIEIFKAELSLVVQGMIKPALDTMVLAHRIREYDFVALAKQSPIVPLGRARLVGKALFAGYGGDFVQSLHLLVPQVENMVRKRLQIAGVKTTAYNKSSENEIGLSALIERPEALHLLGGDLAFEIKALFCSPLGPNLRNTIAHGLLDDDQSESDFSVYAWWLTLKLVFNDFWKSLQTVDAPDGKGQESEAGGEQRNP